ncbi:hypothetical protein RI367_004359 [Sorochytrium milnesiophthora]
MLSSSSSSSQVRTPQQQQQQQQQQPGTAEPLQEFCKQEAKESFKVQQQYKHHRDRARLTRAMPQCLEVNNYDRQQCQKLFQDYKDCKKEWSAPIMTPANAAPATLLLLSQPLPPPPPLLHSNRLANHSDIDSLQGQLVALQRTVLDFDYDADDLIAEGEEDADYSGYSSAADDDDDDDDNAHLQPHPLYTSKDDADSAHFSIPHSSPMSSLDRPSKLQQPPSPAAGTAAAPTHMPAAVEAYSVSSDDVDDIDALYHSMRAQQQQVVSPRLQQQQQQSYPTIPQPSSPPMPTSPNTADERQVMQLRNENRVQAHTIAQLQQQLTALSSQLALGEQEADEREEQLHHLQTLFEQAHSDNQAKYEQIAQMATDLDHARSDLRVRDTEIARLTRRLAQSEDIVAQQQEQLAATTATTTAKTAVNSPRPSPRELELEQMVATLQAAVTSLQTPAPSPQKARSASQAADDDHQDTAAPAATPSQVRAMNRAFDEQLSQQRAESASKVRTLEQALHESEVARRQLQLERESLLEQQAQQAADARRLKRRSDLRARTNIGPIAPLSPTSSSVLPLASPSATKDVDVDREALKVHNGHLQSLLERNLGKADYAHTITSLSLKLSYWTVLRDVYEDTIKELMDWKVEQE